MIKYPKIHPLINPDSPHYDGEKMTAIEALEAHATVIEQIGWCKGNIHKYGWRMNEKGQKERDKRKAETFVAYLKLLESLPASMAQRRVADAYRELGIRMRYRLD